MKKPDRWERRYLENQYAPQEGGCMTDEERQNKLHGIA